VADAAGNEAAGTFAVTVDQSRPGVTRVDGPPAIVHYRVDSVSVVLSDGLADGSFTTAALSLTRDGGANLIDPSVTLTRPSDKAWRIDGLGALTTIEGSYRLAINMAPMTDLAGNTGAGQHVTEWRYVADVTAPRVVAFSVQHGQTQRHSVNAFSLVFSEPTNVDSLVWDGSILSAASLINLGVNADTDPDRAVTLTAGQFRYDAATLTLSWSLDSFAAASATLPDGYYELRIDRNRIVDPAGNALAPAEAEVGHLLIFSTGQLVQAGAADLQVAAYAVPLLVDWNDDGLPDLLIGEKTASGGKIRLYLNHGVAGSPLYTDYAYIQAGGADLTLPAAGCLGAFPRATDWSADGRKDLVVGLADGTVRVYLNVGTDAAPVFAGGQVLEGGSMPINIATTRSRPFVGDYNGDGVLDLLVGGADGLVHLYVGRASPAALGPADILSRLRASGRLIHDGDDEDDNVANTGGDFPRLNVAGANYVFGANADVTTRETKVLAGPKYGLTMTDYDDSFAGRNTDPDRQVLGTFRVQTAASFSGTLRLEFDTTALALHGPDDKSISGFSAASVADYNVQVAPEPATLGLVGLGCAAWALRHRRPRR
jgi:hypothetical protein